MSEYGRRTKRRNVNAVFTVLFALILLVFSLASAFAAPPTITLSKRSVSTDKVSLAWTTYGFSAIGAAYTVDYGVQGSSESTSRTVTTKNTTIQGLRSGTTYWFRVTTTVAPVGTIESNTLIVKTYGTQPVPPPAAPTNLRTTSVAAHEVALEWNDNSGNETGFRIERALAQEGPYSVVGTNAAGDVTFPDTGLAESTTYYYRVYAFNAAGNSAFSNTIPVSTPATPPLAPTGFTARAISPTQITLSWIDNSFNETEYRVMRCGTPDGVFRTIDSLLPDKTAYTDEGLTESTTYYYRVYAVNSADEVYASASATTLVSIPIIPAALNATAVSSSRIDLQWTDTPNETGFVIERGTSAAGPFGQIATPAANATSYPDANLAASTTYYYRICARNSAGASAFTTPVSATTFATIPTAPSGLTARAASSSKIDLAWTDNSSNETGFIVERASAAGGPFTLIATKGAGVKSHSDIGLSASTTYCYRVCATNSAGNSAYTNTANATTQAPPPVPPAAPTGLAASTVSNTEIELTWQDAADNEDGIKIERAASAGGPFALIKTAAANDESYQDTGLTAATTYYYRVCAYNSAGSSAYDGPANATTRAEAPAAPASPSATVISSSAIEVKWIDKSSNEDGFKIERAASAGGPFTLIKTAAANEQSYRDTGLTAATTYYYRVCAYNSAGSSAYAGPVSATTRVDPPAAPTALIATPTSSTQVSLKWTDNASNETGFRVERGTSSTGPFTEIAAPAANTTSYSDTGLSASTTYYYRVCAANSAGNSGYAGPVSVATPAPVPDAPSDLKAVSTSADRIDLTWLDHSVNETGFAIERSPGEAGPFTRIATTAANATGYTDSGQGVNEDTTYYYRVCALNGMIQSSYTTTAHATTNLKAPTALQAKATSCNTIDLTWMDNSSHETNYVIERSLQGTDGTWGPLATLPANTTSYSDQTCQPSTAYYYRVRATGSISDWSNVATTASMDEPLSLEWVGKTPVVGEAYWVAMSGSYAYVTSSTGLQVVDISDPANPLVKSSVDMTYPYDVAADGNGYVYVGAGKTLQVIDVQDPTMPEVVKTLPMPDYAQGVYLSGNRAYVACYAAGLVIVDITQPDAPIVIGTADTPGAAFSVSVTGSTAVVADGTSVQMLDVTNPADAKAVGSFVTNDRAVDVATRDGYAYIAASTAGMVVLDVNDPASPQVVGTGRPTLFGSASGVALSGDRVFVASFSYNSTDNGLQVFSMDDPAAPAQTAFLPIAGRTRGGIAVDGGAACFASGSGGLNVIDISAPDAPALGMRMPETIQSRSAAVSGDYLYALSYSSVQPRLCIFDVTDPTMPSQSGHVDLVYPFDLTVQGTWAYVCDNKTLKVIDVQDPKAPVVVKSLTMPDYAMGVSVSNGKAYVACYAAGLVTVDVSNPYASEVLRTYDTPGAAFSVSVTGNTAVVADGTSVRLFDVTDPADAKAGGWISTSDRAVDVETRNGYAYVAASTAGMLIIDVRNAVTPQVIGTGRPTLFGSASGVALSGGRAFVASFSYNSTDNGLQVFSLADPTAPTQAAFLASPGRYCRTVAVSDGYAYLTDDRFLVQVAGF